MPADPEADTERQRFAALLGKARPGSLRFWWRDDDAETATPALDQLLKLARGHGLPLALAVVPKGATSALAGRLAEEPKLSVLQHGWRHANHAPAGKKKMELGDQRPLARVMDELRRGREKLRRLFPEKFLPVLVPPWNRIGDAVCEARFEVGLAGLSTFGPARSEAGLVNTHLDIFEWRPVRRPLEPAEAYALLALELERRLAGDPEPLGILTHHLVHEERSWSFLDELFGLTAGHPAVAWPAVDELFGLGRKVSKRGRGKGLLQT